MSNKRLSIFLILIGVALFLGSMLGLSNTNLWPVGSLPHIIGSYLSPVSLGIIILGIIIFIRASLKQRAEKQLQQKYEAAPTKEKELPLKTRKIVKFTKITAIIGLGISVASIILGLPPPFLIIGIVAAAAPAIIWTRAKRERREVAAPAVKIEASSRTRKMMRIAKVRLNGDGLTLYSYW